MMLQVSVNGARAPEDHPLVTRDSDAAAADCAEAVRSGASSIHVHPKDGSGRDSLAAKDVDRWVRSFRTACPRTPLGVTTGAWSLPEGSDRVAAIEEWNDLPDFASVNWHEDGAEEVAACLRARGIGVEAGIWTQQAARAWARSPSAHCCLRVLVEIQDVPAQEVPGEAEPILGVVGATWPDVPVLLHGEERSTWSALRFAADRGLGTRIGVEDTVRHEDGSPVTSNSALIAEARRMISARRGEYTAKSGTAIADKDADVWAEEAEAAFPSATFSASSPGRPASAGKDLPPDEQA